MYMYSKGEEGEIMSGLLKGTTICAVRRNGQIAIAGDGQVTMGENTIFKSTARKVRRLYHNEVCVGFAGSVADAFTLCEKFEEKLQQCSGLPLYYLDAIWHKPDKTHIPREEFDERIKEIFKTDKWIIDGNYGRTIEMRIRECDSVFLFDLSTEICIQGATERIGKGRYDLPWLETELDPEFELFIKEFPQTTLTKIYELIEKY